MRQAGKFDIFKNTKLWFDPMIEADDDWLSGIDRNTLLAPMNQNNRPHFMIDHHLTKIDQQEKAACHYYHGILKNNYLSKTLKLYSNCLLKGRVIIAIKQS